MKISFVYPEGGYIFYTDEDKTVKFKITELLSGSEPVTVRLDLSDYYGAGVFGNTEELVPDSGEICAEYELELKKLGYYRLSVSLSQGKDEAAAATGIGVTTRHERSGEESVFGVSCNFWNPERDMPLYERVGVRYIRNPGKDTTIKWRDCLEKHGMYSQVQLQGNDMFFPGRQAHYKRNTAYYYQQQYGNVSKLIEHGNEHWEERDLGLLAEWVKSSGLARIEADPCAWHSGSGAAGIDINKMQVLYEEGMYDYVTFIALHAYSFPNRPESPDSYWSIARLEDLARWMQKNNIDMPVCCTEQGYPAMYDQKKCESYSPGEMITLEAQADYLVRSWLVFMSYGVAKVLWFNGPWYDGFGIEEKDGPAPWPAMMALCQLIRETDGAEYIGDLEETPGVYFKVFRKKDGALTAAVWKPIYYSRSCIKEKNLALDLTGTEADGTVKEKYCYELKYIDREKLSVRDIMGNPVKSDGEIAIGESPLYVSGFTDEILERLTDKTVFRTKTVAPKAAPPKVILGIGDTKPYSDAYASSRFMPGEKREYKIRVHNFSDCLLEDTVEISAPDYMKLSRSEVKVCVKAGMSLELTVFVTCAPAAPVGECRVSVRLKNTAAHSAFQTAAVFSPFVIDGVKTRFGKATPLTLRFKNYSGDTREYKLYLSSEGFGLERNEITFKAAAGQETAFPLIAEAADSVIEPVISVRLECEGCSAVYNPVIPYDYIGDPGRETLQYRIISGYDLMMTSGERYTGPELFGTGKTQPLYSRAELGIDSEKLYLRFEVFDGTVVCAKNVRRNNIDSDGVWIRLYRALDDDKPYRHFSIVPADQAGRASGCYVNEVSAGIKFAEPYTDYDFSKMRISSEIFEDRYIINAEIDRASVGLWNDTDKIVMDIRVINMNHDDWPRFYDTGKTVYKISK